MRQLFLFVLLPFALSASDQNINQLSHRINNCEIEIEMLKQSISSQDASRESLEKEMTLLLNSTKDTLKTSQEGGSSQKKTFDKSLEKFSSDLKQLKTHQNELSQTMNDLSKSIQGLKDVSSKNQESIKELEKAMRSLTLAISGKSAKGSYTVRPGDSLDKIAKNFNMSVSELKELNQLKNSTIRPGQVLQVGE